jgi:hypothetical protein
MLVRVDFIVMPPPHGISGQTKYPQCVDGLAGSSLKPFNNSLSKKFINSSDDRFVAFAVGQWTLQIGLQPLHLTPMNAAGAGR